MSVESVSLAAKYENNDIYGFDVRDTVPVYSWNNRYLSMHRFEIAILKNIEFAFTESVLFGGENEGIQFQYINPVAIFFFSKMSDSGGNENQNALSSKMHITFFPKTWLQANLGIQYIVYQNYQHVENNSQSYFNLFLNLKIIGIFKLFEK